MEPYDTSRRNEDDFHTQALRTTDPTDPFVRFATTDPEVEPEPVVGGSVKHPARARTGLVVIVALLVELIAILGGANQWVADRIQSHTNLVSTPDLFARTMLTYSWRFSPPGGHDTGHAWSAQLLSVVAFLVLSVLLIIPAVGRHVTFFRAFFGVWGAVVLATALARMVVPAVASASVSGGAGGVSRLSRVLFYSSDSRTVAASIALGFVVALIVAVVAVATRRRPAAVVAAPVVIAPEGPLPTAPPPFYGPEGAAAPADQAFDPRSVGFDEHGYPAGFGAPAGFGDAEFSQPRYTATGESSATDRTAAIPVVTDGAALAAEPDPSDAGDEADQELSAGTHDTRQFPVIAEDTPPPSPGPVAVPVPEQVPEQAGPAVAEPVDADSDPVTESEPVTEPEPTAEPEPEPEPEPEQSATSVLPALTAEERAALLDPPRPEPTRNWSSRGAASTPEPETAPVTETPANRPRPDVTAVFPRPTEPDHDGMDDEDLPPRET